MTHASLTHSLGEYHQMEKHTLKQVSLLSKASVTAFNRYAYERSRPLDPAWLDAARRMGQADGVRVIVFPESAARDRLEAAMIDATKAIIANSRMIADSDRWFRNSSAEIDAHRDGPTLEAAGLSFLPLTFARVFPVSARSGPPPTAWRTGHIDRESVVARDAKTKKFKKFRARRFRPKDSGFGEIAANANGPPGGDMGVHMRRCKNKGASPFQRRRTKGPKGTARGRRSARVIGLLPVRPWKSVPPTYTKGPQEY